VGAWNAFLHVRLYNVFSKTTANVASFFPVALAVNYAPKHVMALVSALFPVAMDVNVFNYAKLYPAATAVNVNTYLGVFLAVTMPSATSVAAFKDANFAIALMPVEMDFNVWEIVTVEIVTVEIATVEIATVEIATVMVVILEAVILEDAIWATVIAEMIF
jgi:hypothetical protein